MNDLPETMNTLKILGVGSLLTLTIAALPFATAQTQTPPAPQEKAFKAVVRKVSVKILQTNGLPVSEVSVPALAQNGEMSLTLTLPLPSEGRRTVEINADDEGAENSQLVVTVTDPDRPALFNGGDSSSPGLRIQNGQTLFEVTTLFPGPGEFEIYRSGTERMVVTVQ